MSNAVTPNVTSARPGGKVHKRTPVFVEPWPLCRTGGQTGRGTRFTETSRPVDCHTCLSYSADA